MNIHEIASFIHLPPMVYPLFANSLTKMAMKQTVIALLL